MLITITRVLILAGALVYVAWDAVAFRLGGGSATESTTVGTWMAGSLWITAAVGLLTGHLAGSGPVFDWRHKLTLAAALVAGYLLTRF